MLWLEVILMVLASSRVAEARLHADFPGYKNETKENHLLAYLTSPSRYWKNDRPITESGEPLVVYFKVFIYFLKSQTARTRNYMKSNLLVEMRWRDPRLKYDLGDYNLPIIFRKNALMQQIWSPRIFLANSDVMHVSGSHEKDNLIIIEPSGTVLFTMRVKTKMQCTMYKTNRFPFDYKTCSLAFSSWWNNSTDLSLKWSVSSHMGYEESISPVEFYLDEITTNSSDTPRSNVEADDVFRHGYSTLAINVNLKRRYGFHIMDYYLPCCLLVMMSWLSFWIDPDVVPARVWIGSSSILNFFQLSWNDNIPKTSGIKAYNVWELTVSAFLFIAFVEFAVVNTIYRRGPERVVLKKKSSKYIFQYTVSPSSKHRFPRRRSSSVPSSPEIRRFLVKGRPTCKIIEELRNDDFVSEMNKRVNALAKKRKDEDERQRKKSAHSESHGFFTMTPHEVANWIDKKSRFVFPLSFIIFNLIYWSFLYLPESWFD